MNSKLIIVGYRKMSQKEIENLERRSLEKRYGGIASVITGGTSCTLDILSGYIGMKVGTSHTRHGNKLYGNYR